MSTKMRTRDDEDHIYAALMVKALDKIARQLKEIDESLMTIAAKLDVIAYGEEEDDTEE